MENNKNLPETETIELNEEQMEARQAAA